MGCRKSHSKKKKKFYRFKAKVELETRIKHLEKELKKYGK